MGGVESFSYYLAKNLGLNEYKTCLVNLGNIKSSDERYLDSSSISSLSQNSTIISFDTFFNTFSDISPDDLLIIPMYARPFLEKLSASVKSHEKSPVVFGYLHGMGAYYYDNFKEFNPLISKFISVSQQGTIELNKIFPKRIKDISFIPCPSSISLNENDTKTFLTDDKLNITFIGRMQDSIKGIFRLPLIIKELEAKNIKIKFRIIGNGPDHEELAKRIESLSLVNIEVEYIFDAKTPILVKELLLKSDISLLLSNYEGAPLVIYEALSCGVIPMSYDVGNVSLTIENGVSGMIYSIGEISKIVNDILALNTDRSKLKQMGLNALNRMSELNYSYGSCINKLITAYTVADRVNAIKAIELVDKNKKDKQSNLNRWIKDIIPPGIIHKYYLSHYIQFQSNESKTQATSNFDKQNLENISKKLIDVKQEYDKLKSFHDSVYTNMPNLWLKLGSLLRKTKI
jgi:glycosyltransferase involved in cell wall biosynthesis